MKAAIGGIAVNSIKYFYVKTENVQDHPISCHEGTDGEKKYGFTISSTSTLGGGRVFKATRRPLYPRERDTVPPVQETRWAKGPVWTGAENLALTGIRSADRPVRTEWLYRLSYPGLL